MLMRQKWAYARPGADHVRRRLVPCFSTSHAPGPHSVSPVLTTSRWGAPLEQDRVPGSATVLACRAMVEW